MSGLVGTVAETRSDGQLMAHRHGHSPSSPSSGVSLRLRAAASVSILGLVIGGCVGSGDSSAPPVATTVATASPETRAGAVTTVDTLPSPTHNGAAATGETLTTGVCAEGDVPFTSEGQMDIGVLEGDRAPAVDSDSATLSTLTWESDGTCDRLRISFTTADGAPAVSPPAARGTFNREAGVLRVELGASVARTSWSTYRIDTPIVDIAYVVRRLEGNLMVDVHLAAPAFARMTTDSGPASLVLDVQRGGEPYPTVPVVGSDAIVVSPTGGVKPYPVTVDGYIQTDQGSLPGLIAGTDGTRAGTTSAINTDPVAWEAFVMVFPTGPTGTVVATVGDGAAQATFIAE